MKIILYYVYLISNIINNMCYVGYTSNPKERWSKHKRAKQDSHLSRSIRKYGIDNFKFEVISIFTNKTEALLNEVFWISELKFYSIELYNKTDGGEGCYANYKHTEEHKLKLSKQLVGENNPFYSKKHTEETKLKISQANKDKKNTFNQKGISKHNDTSKKQISEKLKNRKYSEEHKHKMSRAKMGEKNPNFGKHNKHIEETKLKIAQANKGRVVSEETKLKLSIINSGKKLNEETKRKIGLSSSKFSMEEASKIREQYSNGATITYLAKLYKVGRNTIYNIINHKTYI